MMGEKNKQRNKIPPIFDWLSFLAVCVIITDFGQTDPGEMLFLFAYENFVMFLVFYLFVVLITPIHLMIVQKKSLVNDASFFLKSFIQYVIVGFIALCIAFIPFIFLNQLTIELLVEYLSSNGYTFKSFEIFDNPDIFLENWKNFETVYHLKFNFILLFFAIRYFILLTLNFVFHPEFRSNSSVSVLGIYTLISNVILGPVSILLAMIVLVILTALVGQKMWIVLLALALFKLSFNYFSKRLSQFLESI